jgi:hypothetical protein
MRMHARFLPSAIHFSGQMMSMSLESSFLDDQACIAAAMEGDLEMLQYRHNNGYPWNERSCSHAAERGHIELL